MSSEGSVIELADVSKVYRIFEKPSQRLLQMLLGSRVRFYSEVQALKGVGFNVRKGETVGIVGRNGSGKSTLLGMICGTLPVTQGQIRVRGKVAALLELGAGLNPELTGRENIQLSAQIYGLKDEDVRSRQQKIVDFADIGEFIDRPVRTYSSGMFTRLAFAIVAHVDADILVVDEALAVGDAYFVQKCMRHLDAFRSAGGTLLFVSHDMGAVAALCDRAIWLHRGQVLMDASPKQVAEAYLADLYRERQGEGAAVSPDPDKQADSALHEGDYVDLRRELIINSNLRNDIELMPFSAQRGFGVGGAQIMAVRLEAEDGRPLRWTVGGEIVRLLIEWRCDVAIRGLILGFVVKDGKGQPLFGDNTFLAYLDRPFSSHAGELGQALFEFRMPVMPVGTYSVDVAISEGSQQEHVVRQWLHDALIFESHASSVATGLLGIPMRRIRIERVDCKATGEAMQA